MIIRECKLCSHSKVCIYYDSVVGAVVNIQVQEDITEDRTFINREALKTILTFLARTCRFYKYGDNAQVL